MANVSWLPLESNPEVMNKYAAGLGLATESWQFADIWGLDSALLMNVPRPVIAVMLLYPITEKSESEPIGTAKDEGSCSDVYFVKQTISNACGTIGILHALMNNQNQLGFPEGTHLRKFYDSTKGMSPSERATHMESDGTLSAVHEECAQEGQTKAPDREDKTNLHFVCFVHHDGRLYELDGRKDTPRYHGTTTQDTLLEDACEVVKKFMERDPENLNFTMVALTKA